MLMHDGARERGPIGPLSLVRSKPYFGMKPDAEDAPGAAAAEVPWPESWAGPRPSLMMARESGMSFVCQPLSLWNFCIAASVPASQ
jgi:hypothetical protein